MSALLRVAELNAAYAATIDAGRLEAWPDFFIDDCLYKITSAENHRRGYSAGVVYADSRAMLRDRVTAVRTANIYERQSYRHIIGLPLLGVPAVDGINAETPFLVLRIMRDGRTDLFVQSISLRSNSDPITPPTPGFGKPMEKCGCRGVIAYSGPWLLRWSRREMSSIPCALTTGSEIVHQAKRG